MHICPFFTYFILCNLGNILKLNIASQPYYQALEAFKHSRGFLGLTSEYELYHSIFVKIKISVNQGIDLAL